MIQDQSDSSCKSESGFVFEEEDLAAEYGLLPLPPEEDILQRLVINPGDSNALLALFFGQGQLIGKILFESLGDPKLANRGIAAVAVHIAETAHLYDATTETATEWIRKRAKQEAEKQKRMFQLKSAVEQQAPVSFSAIENAIVLDVTPEKSAERDYETSKQAPSISFMPVLAHVTTQMEQFVKNEKR